MALNTEQRRFLTQNWEILDAHYLKCRSIKSIAPRLGKRDSYVRRVLAEAWGLGITCGDVSDYMRRI